ncbi:MAG: hypothetical protein AABX34_03770 [Nanoarchaeota archaeon]
MENRFLQGLKKNRKDILIIILIFLIAIVFFHKFLGVNTLMNNGHHLHEQTFFSYNYKYAMERGTLPFWTDFWYGGQPLYGDSQVFFLNLTHIFIILFGNIFLAINLSSLIYFSLAGISMYFLVKYLIESRSAALISAIVYMFNGLIYGFVVAGNPSILEPYSLMPLIFLFVIKAKKSEKKLSAAKYAVFAGFLLAMQLFSGGSIILLYTLLLIGSYLALDLIGKSLKENLLKTMILGIVMLLAFFGLSAVKLLPNYDFVAATNRAQGLSYGEYIGEDYLRTSELPNIFVFNITTQSLKAHIGITASLLALFSLLFWKRKIVLYLSIITLLMIVIASGGFLAEVLYKYAPAFPQTRHIARVIFVAVFALSVLAGFGFKGVLSLIQKAKANASRYLWKALPSILALIFIFLILTELVFLKGLPKGVNVKEQLEQNELAKYLAEENEKFRITTFDVDDIISFYGSSYYAQYGLETLSGGGGLWINDFVRYLSIAKAQETSKLLGILNLKYVTSTKEMEKEGFKLVKKFDECVPCKNNDWTVWIGGPYLYENENFLPRYYFVDNAVLVVGEDQSAQSMSYLLLINKNFDPKSVVLVNGMHANINDYDINFLKKFKSIIILGGKIDQNSVSKLQDYKNSNGRIFPDILADEREVTISGLEGFFASMKGNITKVESRAISNNEIELMPERKGFLVLSEKFSLFENWEAKQNGKKIDILRADNAISAVYVDSIGTISFKFYNKAFKTGLLISSLTLLATLIFCIFIFIKKYKKINETLENSD